MNAELLKINKSLCNKCELCVKSCVTKSISIDEYNINTDTCFVCFHCLAVCPKKAITYNGKTTENINAANIKEKDFTGLIYSRRSIRNFTDKNINDESVKKIVDLLKYSPTGTNSQKVHITVINSRQRLKTLSDMIMKHFTMLSNLFLNPFFFPFVVLFIGYKKAKMLVGYKKWLKHYWEGKNILSFDAPCLFVFHSPKSSTPVMDCNIASTIGVLYAEVLGLSTCFNGFIVIGISANKKIKRFLNIPANHKIYSSFLLGYAKYKYQRRVIREEIKFELLK